MRLGVEEFENILSRCKDGEDKGYLEEILHSSDLRVERTKGSSYRVSHNGKTTNYKISGNTVTKV
jgi:hypothetical protein